MKQKIIALLLTFSSLLTFASSVVHAEDKATPVKSKYVISSDSSFAPFVFQDNNNQYTGIDMDLIKAIAKDQGFNITIKNPGFDVALNDVQTGHADGMIAGMTVTDARKKTFDFSDSYYSANSILAVAKSSTISSYEDLKGKTVGVKNGTSSQTFLTDNQKKYGYKIKTFSDGASLYDSLNSGSVAAIMDDEPVIRYAIKQGKKFKTPIEGTPSGKLAFAVKKGSNPELIKMFNNGLANLKKNGTYDKILEKYLADNSSESEVDESTILGLLKNNYPQLLKGFGVTIALALLSFAIALVIGIIFEARPNVTIDAGVLCLKTANATILRGGKEAFHTNQIIVSIMRNTLESLGINGDSIQLVEVLDRDLVGVLLQQREYIDVIIPRGGAGLIRRVVEDSSIPVIETGSGVCHTFVDEFADLEMALEIAVNAKVQRPSVCNSMETLLVHQAVAREFLPRLNIALLEYGVRIHGDEAVAQYMENTIPLTEESFSTEYNDMDLNVRIVENLEEAIDHVNRYTTHHSEAIITDEPMRANVFMNLVDCSTVYHNASTRFTDGFEFGFGAEIGISTQKLHARGPMGLQALTSYKYFVFGEGQVRT